MAIAVLIDDPQVRDARQAPRRAMRWAGRSVPLPLPRSSQIAACWADAATTSGRPSSSISATLSASIPSPAPQTRIDVERRLILRQPARQK